jgi:hypothetical protein
MEWLGDADSAYINGLMWCLWWEDALFHECGLLWDSYWFCPVRKLNSQKQRTAHYPPAKAPVTLPRSPHAVHSLSQHSWEKNPTLSGSVSCSGLVSSGKPFLHLQWSLTSWPIRPECLGESSKMYQCRCDHTFERFPKGNSCEGRQWEE